MFKAFLVEAPDGIDYCNRHFRALHIVYPSEALRVKLKSRYRQSRRIVDRLNRMIYQLFCVDNLARHCVIRLDLEYISKLAATDVRSVRYRAAPY